MPDLPTNAYDTIVNALSESGLMSLGGLDPHEPKEVPALTNVTQVDRNTYGFDYKTAFGSGSGFVFKYDGDWFASPAQISAHDLDRMIQAAEDYFLTHWRDDHAWAADEMTDEQAQELASSLRPMRGDFNPPEDFPSNSVVVRIAEPFIADGKYFALLDPGSGSVEALRYN